MEKASDEAKRIADEILGASNPYGDFTAKELMPLADEYRKMRWFMEHRTLDGNQTEFEHYENISRSANWGLIFLDS